MKADCKTTMIAILAAALVPQAHAIEAPVDDAPPPMISPGGLGSTAAAETAFLGLVSSEIPAMLSTHLGIDPGSGILVTSVMPDGPAANAGIRHHDIITRLGDSPIHSPEALSQAVRSLKPGDTVEVSLIHQGQPKTAEVTLGSRPGRIASLQPGPIDQLPLDGVPSHMAERMRNMIEGNLGRFHLRPDGLDRWGMSRDLDQSMREMMKRMDMTMDGALPDDSLESGDTTMRLQQNATVRMLDEQGSIELKSANGIQELTVRDTDNTVVWSGPWTTEDDKSKAPAEVRQRVEHLNLESSLGGSSFKFNFGPPR